MHKARAIAARCTRQALVQAVGEFFDGIGRGREVAFPRKAGCATGPQIMISVADPLDGDGG